MKQREVTDRENTKWVCVQAFSMTGDKAAQKATDLAEKEDGTVEVICTPGGGARSVRLELPAQWENEMSEEALVEAIVNAEPLN